MSTPTLVTFLAYLAGMLGVGFAAYRLTRSLPDYILGGRRLGPAVAALSAGASDMSGWLLLGLPGAVYASGLNQVWIAVGLTVSIGVAVLLLALWITRMIVRPVTSVAQPSRMIWWQ